MTRSKTNDNKADQVFSLFLGMTHTFTIRFIKHRKPATLLLRNIQSLPQNLKNWPFRLLFMLYSILIDLCVGSARLTNSTVSLYIYVAAIFVRPLCELIMTGQCCLSVLALWEYVTLERRLHFDLFHQLVSNRRRSRERLSCRRQHW